MIAWIHRQPITRRILLAIVVGVSSAVLVSGVVFFVWNRYALGAFVLNNLSATAAVMADSLQAAVAFDDREAATEILASLQSKPEVDLACSYNAQGRLLAEYRATQLFQCPPNPRPEGVYTDSGSLVLSQTVRQEGREIGNLYLRRSLDDVAVQSAQQAAALALIAAVSLVVGMLLSHKLQRVISDPIVRLAEMASGVSERHDYSLRATRDTGGEIGLLVDAFNRMLEQIESRTRQLQDAAKARDDFVSVAAHELRNPVNAVQLQLIGVLRAAQRGAQPLTEEWVTERIGQANVQVNRLIRLLDNLLDASRIADHGIEFELEDVELSTIVRTVVERFEEDPRNRHVC